MEQLRLPPPAKDLFRQVYGALDELIRPVSPAGTPGREPCFVNVLGTADALERHLHGQLDAWRRGNQLAPILDPPYRAPRRAGQA